MTPEAFVDFYETLQISPNADTETIHRVFRILAQRYHPDNHETGNPNVFLDITKAYQALSEPVKRAAYDVVHRQARRLTVKIFDQPDPVQGLNAEKLKREGLLSALYRKRQGQPDLPFLTLSELEELLGVPREHLEFALWYLKEGQYVLRTDNARYSVTIKGVDLAEALIAERSAATPVALLDQALQHA